MLDEREADQALARLTVMLADLGLNPKAAKTRIVHLEEGGEGWTSSASTTAGCAPDTPVRHVQFLARWPPDKAMQRIRDRIRDVTDRRRLLLPVEWIVEDLNRVLRGWAGYFRYGNSPPVRQDQELCADAPGAGRGQTPAPPPWLRDVGGRDPVTNQLGLIRLDGIVVAPRPNRDWRGRPNAGGERRR